MKLKLKKGSARQDLFVWCFGGPRRGRGGGQGGRGETIKVKSLQRLEAYFGVERREKA